MAFQPTDEGSPFLDACRWNEAEFEEIEQATTSFGSSPEISIGSNIGKNFSRLQLEGMQDNEITHEYNSSKTESSIDETEYVSSNSSECVRTARGRLLADGLNEFDRSIVRFGKQIGEGVQGVVYEATVHWPFFSKPMTMAVKKYFKLEYNPKIGISQCGYPPEIWPLVCPRLLRPRGFFFDEDSALCLILPMLSGDLRSAIDAEMRNVTSRANAAGRAPFKDLVAFSIIMELAMGMKSLHDIGVSHRDLKAQNVLVLRKPVDVQNKDGIKFFYSIIIADYENSEAVQGTTFWRAPEVLLSQRMGTHLTNNQWRAADVYSFGMTCYEVLTGAIPFDGRKYSDFDIVLNGERPALPDHVPELLGNIIQSCWDPDPGCRPDFGHILKALKEADKYGLTQAHDDAVGRLHTMTEPHIDPEARDPESDMLRLNELVEKHSNHVAHKFYLTYASSGAQFVACATQFVSEFGWNSYITHPKLPFAEFIRREKLYILLTHHFYELGCDVVVNQNAHNNVSHQYWPDLHVEKTEMIFLAACLKLAFKRNVKNLWWEGNDHDLTLKEKLKILHDFTMDIAVVLDEASTLREIEMFLDMLAKDNCLGTDIDDIAKFYHCMKLTIRVRLFNKKYGMLLRLFIGCIVLSLITRFEFWNNVLFRMFGIKLSDLYDVFLGLFSRALDHEVTSRFAASFPKYSLHFSILYWLFHITSFCLHVRSYGFLRYLSWALVGFCFNICVEFVYILLYLSHEYVYLKLVPATS